MRDFIIALNRVYSKNKFIIWGFISIVAVFLIVVNAMEKLSQKNSNSSSVTNTTTIVANNTIENSVNPTFDEYMQNVKSNQGAISTFAKFCNNGQIDFAYQMLSESCKTALFPSKEAFVTNYCNVFFDTNKNVSISQYAGNDTYKVNFNDDILTTGNTSKTDYKQDYITVESGYKLNLLGLVKLSNINRESQNQYVKAKVLTKKEFVDYEEYEVTFKNLTSADIVLENVDEGGSISLVAGESSTINMDISSYSYGDFNIPGNGEKTLSLRFNKNNSSSLATHIMLNNIQIINYQYIVSSDENGTVTKTTTYPSTVALKVSL